MTPGVTRFMVRVAMLRTEAIAMTRGEDKVHGSWFGLEPWRIVQLKIYDLVNRQIENIVILLYSELLNHELLSSMLQGIIATDTILGGFYIIAALYNLCAAPPLRTTHYSLRTHYALITHSSLRIPYARGIARDPHHFPALVEYFGEEPGSGCGEGHAGGGGHEHQGQPFS